MGTVDDALTQKYPMHLHYAEGTWFVSFPDLPGLLTDGETLPLAIERADEARELYLVTALETGAPIPKPGSSVLAQLAAPNDGEHDGAATMQRLMPGLAAVLARLEYGAAKHPDESWRRETVNDHVHAIGRHAEKLALEQSRIGFYGVGRMFEDPEVDHVTVHHQRITREAVAASDELARADVRKQLAAIACRALMALTIDAGTSNEIEKQAHPGEDTP